LDDASLISLYSSLFSNEEVVAVNPQFSGPTQLTSSNHTLSNHAESSSSGSLKRRRSTVQSDRKGKSKKRDAIQLLGGPDPSRYNLTDLKNTAPKLHKFIVAGKGHVRYLLLIGAISPFVGDHKAAADQGYTFALANADNPEECSIFLPLHRNIH
jgi:hypothetical protein